MNSLQKINAMLNQAIIDNNVKLQNELTIIRDALLVASPVKSKKTKKAADKPLTKTIKDNFVLFCQKNGYNAVAPRQEDIGNFWKHHRNAGKHSYDVLVYMGCLLLGEAKEFTNEKYSLNQLNLFERQELKNIGLSPDYLGNIFKIAKIEK